MVSFKSSGLMSDLIIRTAGAAWLAARAIILTGERSTVDAGSLPNPGPVETGVRKD